jgi:hypothetical protein
MAHQKPIGSPIGVVPEWFTESMFSVGWSRKKRRLVFDDW